jgi:hypothetical protein
MFQRARTVDVLRAAHGGAALEVERKITWKN